MGLLLVVAALSACGGGDDGGGGGGSFGKASDALKSGIHAQCDKAFDCKASYDPSMHDGNTFDAQYGTSAQNCYDMTIALLEQFVGADYFDKIDASQSAGRIQYNASDASTCLDEETAMSCDVIFEQNGAVEADVPECDTALVGTVQTGGACTTDLDCATDGDSCDGDVCTAG